MVSDSAMTCALLSIPIDRPLLSCTVWPTVSVVDNMGCYRMNWTAFRCTEYLIWCSLIWSTHSLNTTQFTRYMYIPSGVIEHSQRAVLLCVFTCLFVCLFSHLLLLYHSTWPAYLHIVSVTLEGLVLNNYDMNDLARGISSSLSILSSYPGENVKTGR